jgi:hypothetical protein
MTNNIPKGLAEKLATVDVNGGVLDRVHSLATISRTSDETRRRIDDMLRHDTDDRSRDWAGGDTDRRNHEMQIVRDHFDK